ncbi:hypothetical protein [Priestia megaterium]|uniref:hypothetical protein n=1 Tax=Priestia megaterium TaxID=1404 RepID=UPI0035B6A53F
MDNLSFILNKDNNLEDNANQTKNYRRIFEMVLPEEDDKSISLLKTLFANNIYQVAIQISDNLFMETVKEDLKKYKIEYTIFDPNKGKDNRYFIIKPSSSDQVSYIIDIIYTVSVVNEVCLVCLGKPTSITFQKLPSSKLAKLLNKESWIPCCELVQNSCCAFLSLDGTQITFAENEYELFKDFVF